MAVKIIVRGTLPNEHPKRTRCRYCQTEFEFTPAEDAARYEGNAIEPGGWKLPCPLCSNLVYCYDH